MRLILTLGYPFPYPEDLTDQQTDHLAHEAGNQWLTLEGVASLEMKYCLTVQFTDSEACERAKQLTGWPAYDEDGFILEPTVSPMDGYEYPAIVAGNLAYCGLYLEA